MDKLLSFFKALGFPINKNNALAAAIDNIIYIVNQESIDLNSIEGGEVIESFSPKVSRVSEFERKFLKEKDIVSTDTNLKFLSLNENKELYERYNLLNKYGKIKTHNPNSMESKVWWYELNRDATYKVAMRKSGQGEYRMFILDEGTNNPNFEDYRDKITNFVDAVQNVTEDEVKERMKYCKRR